jgi:hypothetical protein
MDVVNGICALSNASELQNWTGFEG